MESNWKTVRLADISERIGDGLHGTPKYSVDGEYYFVNGNNLESGRIVYKEATKRVNFEEYQKHKKELGNSTLLVSINGTIGNVALYHGEEVVLGKSACYINLKAGISKEFVKYILSGYLFQEYIQRCSTGSTIKNVSLKMMRDFTFSIPESEKEQDKAVELLKLLDQKLHLNQQTNQTLEKMAQTLFKSWFVDFDPVFDNLLAKLDFDLTKLPSDFPEVLHKRAQKRLLVLNSEVGAASKIKASLQSESSNVSAENIHQHFPSEFEHNEQLGWIPKGWEELKIEDILELSYGKALKKADRKEGDVPVYGSGGLTGYHDTKLVNGAGIIVGRKGTVGSLYWEANNFYPIDTVFYVKPKAKYSLVYCFELLKTLGLSNMNTDAAVPGLNRNNAYRLKFSAPNEVLLDIFSSILESYQDRKDLITLEISNLTKLRDTLLPKLISGEITLADSQISSEA